MRHFLLCLSWAGLSWLQRAQSWFLFPSPAAPFWPGGEEMERVRANSVLPHSGLVGDVNTALPFLQGDTVSMWNSTNSTTWAQQGWTWHRISEMAQGRAVGTFCKSLCKAAGYIMVVSNPGVYTIHYRALWQVPTCHSSANTTSQTLISHPHSPTGMAVDLSGSQWGQDLAQDPQEWSKLVCGAAHTSLPLCCSSRLSESL